MILFLTFVTVIFISLFVGGVLCRLFYQQRSFHGSRLEWYFLNFALGALVGGWLALFLAEVGYFSGLLWLVLMLSAALIVVIGLTVNGRPFAKPHFTDGSLSLPFWAVNLPFWVEYVLLALWLVAAVGLFFRPHEITMGGADVGVYVNLAAHMVNSGSISIENEVLATLEPELYPAFMRVITSAQGEAYYWSPGLIVPDQSGRILPPFYHLFPAWQAIAYSLAGVQGALMMTGFWAIWGSLAIYLVVRRLTADANWYWGFIGLAVLSVCALQVWFARYSTTEALTQFLFWAGLWGFIVWGDDAYEDTALAVVSGVAWGSTFLARIDTFFLLPIPILLFIYLLYIKKFGRPQWLFFAPLILLPIHSVIHALLFTPFYFQIIFGLVFSVAERYGLILLTAAVVGLVLMFLVWRWRDSFVQLLMGVERPIRGLAAVVSVVLFAYAWFLRPVLEEAQEYVNPWDNIVIQQWNHENLLRLGWYLSPLGIFLTAIAVAFLIWTIYRRNWALILLGGIYTLLYVVNIRSNAIQIYAMRRYVPMVMPFFIVAPTLLLSAVAADKRLRWLQPAALFVAALWFVSVGWSARGFITRVEMPHYPAEIAQVSEQLDPDSVLLFNQKGVVGIGDHVGVPLTLIHGHTAFIIHHFELLDEAALAQAISRWQSEGRTVYWIDIPGGEEWPLEELPLEHRFGYAIPVSSLETPLTHKPTQVLDGLWPSEVYEIGWMGP